MKKLISFLVLTVMAVLLQGCIVKSLHPFFHESDVIFKKELLATWRDQEGNQWSIRPIKEKHNAYEMHFLHHGEKDVTFLAHLFLLNNELYFDFFPLSDNAEEDLTLFNLHLMPTHSIAKVAALSKDEIQIKWFNEEWMQSLFEQNRIKISHEVIDEEGSKEEDKMYILTASTQELQKFVVKYGGENNAFDDGNTVYLTLKRYN